jgi:hypothetical protein
MKMILNDSILYLYITFLNNNSYNIYVGKIIIPSIYERK